MLAPSAVASLKRVERASSNDRLLSLDGFCEPAAKQREVEHAAATPLLRPAPGEPKSAFFRRLGSCLRRRDLFSPAHTFDRDGLYLYKRPVRSGSGDTASLLAAGGTVFHHVVVYVKQGEELTALEFGPANAMDITENMMVETAAGPVLLRPAPPPEPACLPMLHVAAACHSLEAEHVKKALEYAQATPYHALRNNCICFADFVTRVLTGGAVKGAPLIFDHLVGKVPPVDSPLLALLALTTQMSWYDAVDGSRLTKAFLQQHPAALPPPPGCSSHAEVDSLLAPEPAVPAEAGLAPAEAAAAAPAAQLSAALAAFLGGSSGGASLLRPAGPPAAAAAAVLPADSGSSADTRGGVVQEASQAGATSAGATSAGASLAASNSASLASTGSSSKAAAALAAPLGVKGLQLPARKARRAVAAAAAGGGAC